MAFFICTTCGVQYAPSEQPPSHCPICEDERQYVGWQGQQWTTMEQMTAGGHRNDFEELEPGLTAIWTEPKFGIGQRALLLQTPGGNILFDCLTFVDDATIRAVRERGGLHAIAISHPHFYGACVDWSTAFGDVPIYIHNADREWVMRPDPRVKLWEGQKIEPLPGLTLLCLGGHFDGATALHWPGGADGQGALLSGDTIQVVMDRRYVSFMYSYPNYIPLSAEKVEDIATMVRPFPIARIYGAFGGRNVLDGAGAVERSARRYVEHLHQHP